ncbi:hypothetical protein K502DRAFT_284299, partial [Neoconidiobolus thromboides FSU 785]
INIISLVLSFLLTVIIGSTYVLKFSASKRLSYKLYFFLSLADILSHAPNMAVYDDDMLACQVVTLLSLFSNFLTTFITACMAYNLMIIFLLDKPKYVKSCTFYVVTCCILSVICCIPIAVLSFINVGVCPYYDQFKYPINKVVLFFTFGNWILLPTLYCLVIFIIVILKLNKARNKSSHNSNPSSSYQQFNLRRMVTRLLLYPTVPVITILPYLVVMILAPTSGDLTYADYVVQFFCASVQGILNFVFFLFDPALPAIFSELKERYFTK